jgi:hypothetical protein
MNCKRFSTSSTFPARNNSSIIWGELTFLLSLTASLFETWIWYSHLLPFHFPQCLIPKSRCSCWVLQDTLEIIGLFMDSTPSPTKMHQVVIFIQYILHTYQRTALIYSSITQSSHHKNFGRNSPQNLPNGPKKFILFVRKPVLQLFV